MRVSAGRAVLAVALLLAPAAARSAAPADRLLVRGLFDATFVDTDDGSRLLSENGGDPAMDLGLRLWLGGDLGAGFQAIVVGLGQGGRASDAGEADADLEQAYVRWTSTGAVRLTVDAGRIVVPFGDFSRRYLSSSNPLIGAPDGYGVSYPIGIVAMGSVARFDYRAGVIDAPLVNDKYVPEPGRAYRPGLEIGVTPTVGLRIGAYGTIGPYLGPEVASSLPTGESWRDFEQRVAAMNLELSRGHFALHAEYAMSDYEVPTLASRAKGRQWFVEPAYAWTPRLFTALRLEANDYPYIAPLGPAFWIAPNAQFRDLEAAVGWRFSRGLVVKTSYRLDKWRVEPSLRAMLPDGHAVALQVSYAFDVLSWFDATR
jgi:hypothetical protein